MFKAFLLVLLTACTVAFCAIAYTYATAPQGQTLDVNATVTCPQTEGFEFDDGNGDRCRAR